MITYVRESVVDAMKADHKNDLAHKDKLIRKIYKEIKEQDEKIARLKKCIEDLGGSL